MLRERVGHGDGGGARLVDGAVGVHRERDVGREVVGEAVGLGLGLVERVGAGGQGDLVGLVGRGPGDGRDVVALDGLARDRELGAGDLGGAVGGGHLVDGHVMGDERVGDGEALGGRARDGRGVAVHRVLGDGVGDGLAVGVLGEPVEGRGPAVVGGERRRLAGVGAVRDQVHGDRRRAEAVLVLRVVPDLGDADGRGVGGVGVGDGEALGGRARDGRGVAVHRVLGDGVGDGLAVGVLGEPVEGRGPAVVGGERRRLAGVGAVRDQVHGDRRRAEAVLVLRVVPDLGDADGRGVGGIVDFYGFGVIFDVERDGLLVGAVYDGNTRVVIVRSRIRARKHDIERISRTITVRDCRL